MKHRFLNLIQVSFCTGPEAENEFKGPCEPWKHRFLDLTKGAFLDGQEEENEFKLK